MQVLREGGAVGAGVFVDRSHLFHSGGVGVHPGIVPSAGYTVGMLYLLSKVVRAVLCLVHCRLLSLLSVLWQLMSFLP